MNWLAIILSGAIAAIVVKSMTSKEDTPGLFSNPWLDLDVGNLDNLECNKLPDGQFEVKAKLKSEKKSVVQLTKTLTDGKLELLIQRADLQPVSSRFLYTLTDDQGNLRFKFRLPEEADKIVLKYSGHLLWSRSVE